MPATASRPAISSHGESALLESSAARVPNTATSAKVRSPALAEGLRSRSSPISRPMARLVRNCGKASMPLPCRKPVSIASLLCAPVADDLLQALRAIVFIDAQAVYGMDLFGQRLVVPEQYRLDGFSFLIQAQFQMPFADHALVLHGEVVVELRGGEALAPNLFVQQARHIEAHLGMLQRAVGLDALREVAFKIGRASCRERV